MGKSIFGYHLGDLVRRAFKLDSTGNGEQNNSKRKNNSEGRRLKEAAQPKKSREPQDSNKGCIRGTIGSESNISKYMYRNARSMGNKQDEVEVAACDRKYDLTCIAETV